MSIDSGIQWCTSTLPLVVGCTKISPGCAQCYAVKEVARLAGNPNPKIQNVFKGLVHRQGNGQLNWSGEVRFRRDILDWPRKVHKSKTWFISSLGDLGHPAVSAADILLTFQMMAECYWHLFMVLSKYPDRFGRVLYGEEGNWAYAENRYLENVMLGTSVEDSFNLIRLLKLKQTGWQGYIFVSVEPLLKSLSLREFLRMGFIDLVIVGGESGPHARPCDLNNIRRLRDECAEYKTNFFVKQLGTAWAKQHSPGDRKGGSIEHFPKNLQIRQFPDIHLPKYQKHKSKISNLKSEIP